MNYLSEKAKGLTPYVAGLQPQESGWIKLNTNENPYPPSPKVLEAIKNADLTRLRLYPDGDSTELRKAIASNLGVSSENIFCGNGSDEVLALAFQAFFSGKVNVMTPDISYGFYTVWGSMYDVGLEFCHLNNNFTIDTAHYKNANGVVIANPNAPTSMALERFQIELILKNNPNGVVIIDEAYIDFANVESAVNLLEKYENLLVVRTFSKSHSLAGMRVGYAIGHPALIEALRLMRDSFNSYPLDMLAQTAAIAAIQNETPCSRIMNTRGSTITHLHKMGYEVPPSQTNFILIITAQAGELYAHLHENKILTRYWDRPRLKCYLRVSIGTDDEMEVFLKCVQDFIAEKQKRHK